MPELKTIPVERLHPSPFQPREAFDRVVQVENARFEELLPAERQQLTRDRFGARRRAPDFIDVGPCGMGSTVKLVTNLVMGLNGVVLAEGLTLARRAGVDPAQMLEVLRHGAAASKMLEIRGPLMVEGRFDAMMKVDLFLKDIRLMLEAAQALHVPLPLTGAMQQLYTAALAAGQAKDDLASIVRVYEAMAGLPPRAVAEAE